MKNNIETAINEVFAEIEIEAIHNLNERIALAALEIALLNGFNNVAV
jgi:hypothetical protein